jgi:hypothetical protein
LIHPVHLIDAGTQHSLAVVAPTVSDSNAAGRLYIWGAGKCSKAVQLVRYLAGGMHMESDDDERDRKAAEEAKRQFELNWAAERALAVATTGIRNEYGDGSEDGVRAMEPSSPMFESRTIAAPLPVYSATSSSSSTSSSYGIGSGIERSRTPPMSASSQAAANRRPLGLAELREGKTQHEEDDDDSGDDSGVALDEKVTVPSTLHSLACFTLAHFISLPVALPLDGHHTDSSTVIDW